jgi:hypothetical protein
MSPSETADRTVAGQSHPSGLGASGNRRAWISGRATAIELARRRVNVRVVTTDSWQGAPRREPPVGSPPAAWRSETRTCASAGAHLVASVWSDLGPWAGPAGIARTGQGAAGGVQHLMSRHGSLLWRADRLLPALTDPGQNAGLEFTGRWRARLLPPSRPVAEATQSALLIVLCGSGRRRGAGQRRDVGMQHIGELNAGDGGALERDFRKPDKGKFAFASA